MVEDSQNDGRITLASIHTGHTVVELKEVRIPSHRNQQTTEDTLPAHLPACLPAACLPAYLSS